ncbi:MAG TPA: hypothetical protein VMY42_24080 [Thermoguttaceae bacterium]|nr:hypothetical protein [Thermoguttaceae bacterium]
MAEMTTEQIQDELRRGIEFYKELDGQILAFLNRLAEVLEDKYELGRLKKPFAKDLRRSSVVQSYVLLMKPTGAEIESDEVDDDAESEEEEEDEVDTLDLTFAPDAKLPYVIVQMIGRVPAGAKGSVTTPFIQYGTLAVAGRKDGKELENPVVMRTGYYSGVFRNRMCNPRSKPPYSHKAHKGGATLIFEEHSTAVQPLGSIQTESDIEQLAKKVAETIGVQG